MTTGPSSFPPSFKGCWSTLLKVYSDKPPWHEVVPFSSICCAKVTVSHRRNNNACSKVSFPCQTLAHESFISSLGWETKNFVCEYFGWSSWGPNKKCDLFIGGLMLLMSYNIKGLGVGKKWYPLSIFKIFLGWECCAMDAVGISRGVLAIWNPSVVDFKPFLPSTTYS